MKSTRDQNSNYINKIQTKQTEVSKPNQTHHHDQQHIYLKADSFLTPIHVQVRGSLA